MNPPYMDVQIHDDVRVRVTSMWVLCSDFICFSLESYYPILENFSNCDSGKFISSQQFRSLSDFWLEKRKIQLY